MGKAKKEKRQKDTSSAKKKGMGLRAKMLVGILPFVVVALVLLTAISGVMSRNIIRDEIHSNMAATLTANATDVNDKLGEARTTAKDIAVACGNTFHLLDDTAMTKMFTELVDSNDLVYAAGAFLEPYVKGEDTEFFAPYFIKDGEKIVQSAAYMDGKTKYTEFEWYQWAKQQDEGVLEILDPQFDEKLGAFVIRTVTPVYDVNDRFIGVISVDINLDTFDQMMSGMEFGDGADYAVTTADGTYVYSANRDKVESFSKITEEAGDFGRAAKECIAGGAGNTEYDSSAGVYHLYYTTIPDVEWKIISRISDERMFSEATALVRILIIICVLAVVICVISIFIQTTGVTKAVRRVEHFAGNLSQGDFTVDRLVSKRKDEIGHMAGALNVMYDNNRGMIGQISENSHNVNDSSTRLHDVAVDLSERVTEIHDSMIKVNDAMMSSSAATQEVSASVNEVNASVQKLAEETGRTDEHVKDIKTRAIDIQQHSSAAFQSAKEVYDTRSTELEEARKKAEVVKEIGNLASSIADIADQIDLLSLNASIEAARAGEHGKGFAVVASEINKLAAETGAAVEQIQTTINAVQDAFEDLSSGASNLLDFVSNQVTPDYETFVDVGRQYGEDAESFAELTADIQEMIGFIRESMDQVNAAVSNIAESTQDTATSSSEITETVSEVNEMVGDVSQMVKDQAEVAKSLHEIVTKYKL